MKEWGNVSMTNLYEIIFDMSQKNLESQKQRYKDIDNKAISIITITGILTSFLVGSGSLINYNAIDSSGSFISRIIYALTALSFLLTVLLSVLVIKVRDIQMFDTKKLFDILIEKNLNESEYMKGMSTIYNKYEHHLYDTCNRKATKLKYSVYCLGGGVVFLILYSILAFY